MAKSFKAADKVTWNSSQGRTHGRVKRKLTSDKQVSGEKVSASKDDPRYLVVSDKTGKEAAHKAEALE